MTSVDLTSTVCHRSADAQAEVFGGFLGDRGGHQLLTAVQFHFTVAITLPRLTSVTVPASWLRVDKRMRSLQERVMGGSRYRPSAGTYRRDSLITPTAAGLLAWSGLQGQGDRVGNQRHLTQPVPVAYPAPPGVSAAPSVTPRS